MPGVWWVGGELQRIAGAMAGRLADFFGLDDVQREQVFAAVGQHAKQPSEVFVGDSDDKRSEASVLLREQVERWAREPYEALVAECMYRRH